MAKSEWGMKRTCLDCEAPFYDLKKKNIVCPKCGAAFDPAPPAKPKRAAPVEKPAPKPEAAPSEEKKAAKKKAPPLSKVDGDGKDGADAPPGDDNGGDADANAGDDDDKDLIEDTSDLGRDDDDMSEVKEHIDSGVEDKN